MKQAERPGLRRRTRHEYERLIDHGFLDEDDPIELYAPGSVPEFPPVRAEGARVTRVKGIVWLNPEGQWGRRIGDSVMPLYAPSCDFVRECRTIAHLGEVVDNLVHHWWRRGR